MRCKVYKHALYLHDTHNPGALRDGPGAELRRGALEEVGEG